MANILSISIDGTNVTNYLLQDTNFIKIMSCDKILVERLFLIINKAHYKGPLPKEHSVIEFVILSTGVGQITKEIFYIYKDDNASNSNNLTEAEKTLAKDPNNVVFYGLSVKSGFTKLYDAAVDKTTSPPANVFKNKTLKQVLECMKDALGLDELLVNHQKLDNNIPYLKANKIQLKQDGSYYKTIIEELADIFYSVANIRNNKLYFFQKRYSGNKILFKSNISLSSSSVIDISNIKGQYDNNPPYKGVKFNYFKENERNIALAARPLGEQPFFQLSEVYEKSLANIYAVSKLKEINEPPILKLRLKDILNKIPGYYLLITKSKSKVQEHLEKRVADILGGYTVKECIITYSTSGYTPQDPNEAGPSSKKAKLEPSWSTTLHLIKMSGGLNN